MKNLFSQKPYGAKLTIPNIITAIGIALLIPYIWGFLANGNRWVMFGALFLAGCSDLFDGLLARRLKQRTRIGEMIDPLRDRLICGAVLLNMLYLEASQVIVWMGVGIIVVLEMLITFVNYMSGSKARVHLVGKLRQAGHLLACGLVIISCYFNDVVVRFIGLSFNFSLELALVAMALFSSIALLFYSKPRSMQH